MTQATVTQKLWHKRCETSICDTRDGIEGMQHERCNTRDGTQDNGHKRCDTRVVTHDLQHKSCDTSSYATGVMT